MSRRGRWWPAALLAAAALLGDTSAGAEPGATPGWWLAVGGHAAIETGDLDTITGTEGGAHLAAGVHLLRLGPILLGPEAEGSVGRLTADLGTLDEDVTVWRGRVGIRATWWPDAGPRLVPYLRAGAVYRADRSDLIEDDGFGWYAGGGLDVMLTERWALGPSVTYEAVSLSVDTETWLVGLRLTFFP